MLLDDLLTRSARLWPEVEAIRERDRTPEPDPPRSSASEGRFGSPSAPRPVSVTYAAYAAEVDRWARRLAPLVRPGDRVALVSRNRVEFAALYFAVARLGGVAVAHSWRLLPAELADQIADAEAVVVVADSPAAAALEPYRSSLPDLRCRIDLDGATAGWSAPSTLPLGEVPSRRADEDEVVVQMYTSGTTGRAKGAMLSHRNLCHMVLSWSLEMPLRGGETRFLQVTPLFHVGGLMMVLLNAAAGSTLLLEPEFQPAPAIRRLQRDRATHSLLVPAMLRWMMLDPAIRGASFPDLELVLYGASPFPAAHLVDAMKTFGCSFLQAYGLTETSGVITGLTPAEHARALADEPALLESAGRAMMGCEVRVLSADGRPLPDGETGEIVVRGPNIFVGYWRCPDATAEVLRDGWLWTGDVGWMDGRGYVTIVDRSKDMIIVGGVNVYPSEIEAVVRQVEGVRETAVIGVPHDVWGESVLAVVVPEPGADRDELPIRVIEHTRARLARFKCPTRVELVEDLPRTPAGKVQKGVLRAPHWAGRTRSV